MTKRIRTGGPIEVIRPYRTIPPTDEPIEQIAQALDHIAAAMSAIDHNVERIAQLLDRIEKKLGGQLR